MHVVHVHAACGPSEVVPLPEDHQPPVPADGYDMTMTAAVLDHGGATLPVLVAETVSKAYAFDGTTGPAPMPELTNVVASSLMGDGFTLGGRGGAPHPGERQAGGRGVGTQLHASAAAGAGGSAAGRLRRRPRLPAAPTDQPPPSRFSCTSTIASGIAPSLGCSMFTP